MKAFNDPNYKNCLLSSISNKDWYAKNKCYYKLSASIASDILELYDNIDLIFNVDKQQICISNKTINCESLFKKK